MTRDLFTAALLVLFALGTAQCGKPTPPPLAYSKLGIPMRDGRPDLSLVSITLSRSPCYGWCPCYEVTLLGSGKGAYVGHMNVVVEGRAAFEFQPEALAPVLELLESLDFMQMRHDADGVVFDAPFAQIELSIEGRSAIFKSAWLQFCNEDAEPAHTDFHRRFVRAVDGVDRIADIDRWIGSEDLRQKRFDR